MCLHEIGTKNCSDRWPPPKKKFLPPLGNLVSSEIVKTKNMNVNTNTLQTGFGCALGFGTKSVTKRVRYHLALYSICRLAKPVAYRTATVSGHMMEGLLLFQGESSTSFPYKLTCCHRFTFSVRVYGPLAFASIGLPQGRAFQLCKAGASVPEVVYTRIPFGTKYMLTN